jgi:hypothetical protein
MIILVWASAAAAASQDTAPQLVPASAGQDVIRGVSGGDTRQLRIKIHQPDGAVAQVIDVLVQQDRSFLAGFPKPLEAGQIAVATILVDGVEAAASAPVLVRSGTAQPARTAVQPPIANRPAEADSSKPSCTAGPIRFAVAPQDGQTTLYAIGSPSTDDLKCAVSVFVNGDEAMVVNSVGTDAQSVQTGTDPAFSVQLKEPLASGQCVVLMQFEKGHAPASIAPGDLQCPTEPVPVSAFLKLATSGYVVSPGVLVTSFLNLGRVRSYFAGGLVLAHDNGNFTNANTFLSFNLDKNWVWGGPVGTLGTGPRQYRRMMFNTYFETRLTAIPVATGDAIPVTSSRQAATLSAGAYAPFAITTWTDHRDPYALTLGPISKVGFDTPITAGTGAACQADFYTDFGFGGRMGVSKMSYSKDVAPELVSYLDVVAGRFSNFDAPALDDGGRIHRPWRLQIEGVLKVPGYPLVIGFEANIRQNLGIGRAWEVTAKDDLRFFFGTRFDAGRAMARLTGQK